VFESKDNDRRGQERHLDTSRFYIHIYICVHTHTYLYVCVLGSFIATERRIRVSTRARRGSEPASQPSDQAAANHPVDRVIMTARLTPTGYASLMVLVPLPAAAPTIHGRVYIRRRRGSRAVVSRTRIFIIFHRVSAKRTRQHQSSLLASLRKERFTIRRSRSGQLIRSWVNFSVTFSNLE